MTSLAVNDIERFHNSYIPVTESGCYLWEKALVKDSAKFKAGGKMLGAARVAWTLINGPIPNGLLVCHKCDNPACVNPAHLFLGTHKDNHQDRERKGRHPHSSESSSNLTKDIVFAIHSSPLSRKETAIEFGVSESIVNRIWNGKRWKDLNLPKRDGRNPISDDKILAIYNDNNGVQIEIGKRHGVSQIMVSRIKRLARKRYQCIIDSLKED